MTPRPIPGPPPARRTVPECHDEVCITCSDSAVPARVLELLGDGLAVVDAGAGAEEVSVALVDADVDDLVLVHAKEAVALIREAPEPGENL